MKLASGMGPYESPGRPNGASKMFWAEALATKVRSVVTVMPVTRMSLTPRLKRVWQRSNKAKVPDSRANHPQAHHSSITFGGGRKYD